MDFLNCPFCGSEPEITTKFSQTLEQAILNEKVFNCSSVGCAGRHVCATEKEWQFRELQTGKEKEK